MKRESIPQGVRFNVFRRDGFTCRYCGRSSPAVVLHCDHVKPRAKGGSDSEDNYVTACSDCNYGKGVKEVELPEQKIGSLVGFYGLTLIKSEYDENLSVPEWQFKVIRQLDDGYMVQLYDWMIGESSRLEYVPTVTLLDSKLVRLYATHSDWRADCKQMQEWDNRLFRAQLTREQSDDPPLESDLLS